MQEDGRRAGGFRDGDALEFATLRQRQDTATGQSSGEVAPIAVQIAGSQPQMMADAARHNVERGVQIIDINMGRPATAPGNVMAGSALLRDEALVGRILDAVVRPETLQMGISLHKGILRQVVTQLRIPQRLP